jgi:hypothetical protein
VTGREVAAFFYGLYMDEAALRDKGIAPRNPRRAVVPGYRTRIGVRATLQPRFGAQAFGMVFDVTHAELHRLYAGAGLDMYRAEGVLAFLEDGSCAPVVVFNLVEPPAPDESNPDYAAKLRGVLERLGLPAQHVE